MSIYSTSKPLEDSTVSYAHPSVARFKEPQPQITVISFGIGISNFKFGSPITSSKISNSSALTKDIKIGDTEILSSKTLLKPSLDLRLMSDNSSTIDIDQGINNSCAMIPWLHAIQHQMPDFPIDFAELIDCIPVDSSPSNLSPRVQKGFKNIINGFHITPIVPGQDIPQHWTQNKNANLTQLKILNLLFGGHCIPISERPKVEKCSMGYVLPEMSDKQKEKCSGKKGIKIKAKLLPEELLPQTMDEIIIQFEALGPRPIQIQGDTVVRLFAMWTNPSLTWDQAQLLTSQDLIEMFGEAQYNNLSRFLHDLTIVGVNKTPTGETLVTLRNSWANPNEFTINSSSLQPAIMEDNFFWSYQRLLKSIVIEVQECDTGNEEEEEEEGMDAKCKRLGYDKYSGDPDAECPCECDTVTNNRGVTVQKVYKRSGEWKAKCLCSTSQGNPPSQASFIAPEVLCGGSYDPEQEFLSDCDCKCKKPDSKFPCSGYEDYSQQIFSNFNISPIASLKIL
jgi:hypothetical protein